MPASTLPPADPHAEYTPTEAERAGIDRGLADAQAGRFATEEDVAAVFARCRRP
jgi:predicted transcriptional regulator